MKTMTGHRLILVFSIVAVLIVGSAPTSANFLAPAEGDVVGCDDGYYVVSGVAEGSTSSAWWLTMIGGSYVRVGWSNSQVGVKSTTIQMTVTYSDPLVVAEFGVSDHYSHATGVDITDACGDYGPIDTRGTAAGPSDVDVDVSFSGIQTQTTASQGYSISHSETTSEEFTYSVSATESTTGGEISQEWSGTVGYEETKSETFESGSSISWTSDETQATMGGAVPPTPAAE